MAYRNCRAHRELQEYANDQLNEFLLLNHLYLLLHGVPHGVPRVGGVRDRRGPRR